ELTQSLAARRAAGLRRDVGDQTQSAAAAWRGQCQPATVRERPIRLKTRIAESDLGSLGDAGAGGHGDEGSDQGHEPTPHANNPGSDAGVYRGTTCDKSLTPSQRAADRNTSRKST